MVMGKPVKKIAVVARPSSSVFARYEHIKATEKTCSRCGQLFTGTGEICYDCWLKGGK